jgi:hypothetical protein
MRIFAMPRRTFFFPNQCSMKFQEMRTALVCAMSALALSGCFPERAAIESGLLLDTKELATALEPGASAITGEALTRTSEGGVHPAANEAITLLPGTPYVLECARIRTVASSHCAEALNPFTRTTKADSQGRFSFTALKPGHYHLETTIPWRIRQGLRGVRYLRRTLQADVTIEEDGKTIATVLQ